MTGLPDIQSFMLVWKDYPTMLVFETILEYISNIRIHAKTHFYAKKKNKSQKSGF